MGAFWHADFPMLIGQKNLLQILSNIVFDYLFNKDFVEG